MIFWDNFCKLNMIQKILDVLVFLINPDDGLCALFLG